MSSEPKKYDIPPQGSLGLLAVGHKGVIAWREVRDKAVGKSKNEGED